MKKYAVKLQCHCDITDVERIINYQEQGWNGRSDEYHSDMVFLYKWVEIEMEGEAGVKMYIDALNAMMRDIEAEEYYEIKNA